MIKFKMTKCHTVVFLDKASKIALVGIALARSEDCNRAVVTVVSGLPENKAKIFEIEDVGAKAPYLVRELDSVPRNEEWIPLFPPDPDDPGAFEDVKVEEFGETDESGL